MHCQVGRFWPTDTYADIAEYSHLSQQTQSGTCISTAGILQACLIPQASEETYMYKEPNAD